MPSHTNVITDTRDYGKKLALLSAVLFYPKYDRQGQKAGYPYQPDAHDIVIPPELRARNAPRPDSKSIRSDGEDEDDGDGTDDYMLVIRDFVSVHGDGHEGLLID